MANKQLKTLTFPGLTDTYIVNDDTIIAPDYNPAKEYKIGNLLTYLGKQYYCIADAPAGTLPTNTTYFEEKSVADIIEMIKNGSIVTGHSEVADNLTPYSEDSGTTQDNPFISQATGTDNNSVIVTTGTIARQLEKQGNTLSVCQMAHDYTGKTIKDSNTNWTLQHIDSSAGLTLGHKYVIILKVTSVSSNMVYRLRYPFSSSQLATSGIKYFCGEVTDQRSIAIQTMTTDENEATLTLPDNCCQAFDITGWNSDIITDLTSHPEHFSWYYNGSLVFDAGSLANCNGRYLECGQGRNLFAGNDTDSSQYIGHYYVQPGNNNYARTSNNDYNCYRIMVVPNVTYFIGRTDGTNLGANAGIVRFVDKDYNLITGSESGYSYKYFTFTTPANCRYIEISLYKTVGDNTDVELYYTAEQGGEGYLDSNNTPIHYPYVAPIRIDTGNETLKAFDKKLPSGVIERNTSEYTFTGNEDWTYYESGVNSFWYISLTLTKHFYNKSIISNGIKAGTLFSSGSGDMLRVYIRDNPNITSSTNMNTIFPSGTKMQYNLSATDSTTEQGTPFSEYAPINDYSYMAWFDTDGNLVSIPQGCKLFYPVDYKGFLDDGVMYTNGDFTALAKNESITDAALQARGYYKMQDLLSAFGANGMVGGTLRQTLANAKSLDFNNTNCVDLGAIPESSWYAGYGGFYTQISDIETAAGSNASNMLCTKYKEMNYNNRTNLSVSKIPNDKYVLFLDSNYSTIPAFVESLKGQLLAYKKAST